MTPFHAALDTALKGNRDALIPHLEDRADALSRIAVYANTVATGRTDALAANYPTIVRMVGPDWFRAAAGVFAGEIVSASAVLVDYGADFPDWLKRFGPARPYPYLAPCARLDRAWTEAHIAMDAPRRPQCDSDNFVLHPSVRLFSFDWNAPSLWLAHRFGDGHDRGDLEWRPQIERILVHRPDLAVTARLLDPAEWTLLRAVRRGMSLHQAVLVSCAATARDQLDLAAERLVNQGAFVPRILGDQSDDHH